MSDNLYYPLFSEGMLLKSADLNAIIDYFSAKLNLCVQTVMGFGIIFGLEVSLDDGCFSVSPGAYIDCNGCFTALFKTKIFPLNQVFKEDECNGKYFLCAETHKTISTTNDNHMIETLALVKKNTLTFADICLAEISFDISDISDNKTAVINPKQSEFNFSTLLQKIRPEYPEYTEYIGYLTIPPESRNKFFQSEYIQTGFPTNAEVDISLSLEIDDTRIDGDFDIFYPGFKLASQYLPKYGCFRIFAKIPTYLPDELLIRWCVRKR